MNTHNNMSHAVPATGLAEVLERILDKGVVIAGDIKIKLVDIELLTIQIRLMIASVDKAREMGMDWWMTNQAFNSKARLDNPKEEIAQLHQRIQQLETQLQEPQRSAGRISRPEKPEKRDADRF